MTSARLILIGFLAAAPLAAAAEVSIRVHSAGLSSLTVPPGTPFGYAVSAAFTAPPASYPILGRLEIELHRENAPRAASAASGLDPSIHGNATRQSAISLDGAPLHRNSLAGILSPNQTISLIRGTMAAPDVPGVYRVRAVWHGAAPLPPHAPSDAPAVQLGLLLPVRSQDLWLEVLPDAPAIVDSYPPAGAIDARQPWAPDGTDVAGWSSLELIFAGDTQRLSVDDFTVQHTARGPAPQVQRIVVEGPRVLVELTGSIEPGGWTTIVHRPSGTGLRVGFLPGDVNADRGADAGDVVALIDRLAGQSGRPPYATDIDRNGETDADDLSRLLELLNGLEAYPVFLGVRLPQ